MEDLAEYFHMLNAAGCEVIVVDASSPDVFALHDERWSALCRHVPLDPRYCHPDDTVNGVLTGIDLAAGELIIVGEEDIRYTWNDIDRMGLLLERHEMAVPQNYLSSLPWWACIEAAGMLINRGMLAAGDFSGTFAFRRSMLAEMGHYDAATFADTEEILHHFVRNGAKVGYARSFFIEKEPPAIRTWLEGRPRQGMRAFGAVWMWGVLLGLPPAGILLGLIGGWIPLLLYGVAIAAVSILMASRGRREGAQRFFPESILWWGPVWALERSISAYLVLYRHLADNGFGGVGSRKGRQVWGAGGQLPLHATEGRSGKSGK
jgi:hypothetical protein